MFGYVVIQKSELLVRQFEEYKSVYCSLCKAMGKEYGILSRFMLSYDATFYSLMQIALKGECPHYKEGKCKFNPLKKCTYTVGGQDELNRAAAFSVLATYYKIVDDIADTKGIKKLFKIILKPYFSHLRKKAIKKGYTDFDNILSTMTKEQRLAEASPDVCLDMACQPTANMLSSVLSLYEKDETRKRILQSMGYYLGRWIYLMDAVDDYNDDLKHTNFNPYLINDKREYSDVKQYAKQSLNQCVAEICVSYNLLSLSQYKEIIENILFLGLENKQNLVMKKDDKKGK